MKKIILRCKSVSLGFFYREPSAAGGYYWLPALLGWNLANVGNTKTVKNNRNWAMLLLHDVYFIRSKDPQIHNNHGCKTTISWFRRTWNESKITLYYWLCTMFMMQFIDLLIVHSFFSFYLSFLCLEACLFHCLWKPAEQMRQNDPPNKCAKMTRQNILPWQPARFTCENNPPNLLARKICHFNSRLACQRSPLLCSKSPGWTRPANPPPPPPAAPQTEQGEGAGSRPGPATHIEQVLLLSFPISWMATYSYMTWYIHILYRADWYEIEIYWCRRKNNC